MRYGSVCSGVEAASVAWEPLGFEPVFFSEIEPFPSAVLAHHWPDVPNYGDMNDFMSWPFKKIDILVGGTPCQSFSIAGLKKGLSDARGNLSLTYMRMVDQLRPRWTVWENVPGVLSSGGGRDFGSIVGALAELGYSCAWRVLDAQNFGVPQRRRRVFLIGCSSGDWRDPSAILFESGCGGRDFETRRKTQQKNTETAARCFAGNKESNIAATLQTTMHDYTRSDGFNVVCVEDNRRDGLRIHGNKTQTLQSFMGTGGGNTPIVVHANKVAPAITSSGPPYSRTGNQRVECDALVVHGSQDPIVSDKAHAIGRNHGQENVLAYGVKTAHTTSNGWGIQEEKTHTLDRTGTTPAVFDKTTVRRLTPVEAERLQGFPDGHTDIGWKGKPTPDSHRYKAMGNSMAVPVMRWIGQRIKEHDA